MKEMIDKNVEKAERKGRRKPPIPYSPKEPSKKQRMKRLMKKHDRFKNSRKSWDNYD